ncbi:PEP-CTERM sorting domain-containing protein [Sphingomonas sp. AP4-R1]|uniref:PEPxxWA-CTERM sorting domain-containing protein n=1 Tax=Sphingomonas sp. AP4-R1 TaxID=2735134 RepID=UPI0014932CFF|nr:PEPxxWA-CTERM sorting domain-containing protein [Sphingomonas sp. AP4-R1]QJU56618.1 PEP-CTERM sorting domain-containing protein [Sphingomonas sp. AP4-R1]
MMSRIQGLAVAVTASAIAMAAPASAASFVFDTTGSFITSGAATFSSNTVGGTTLNVRVSAWQATDKSGNTDLDDISAAKLGAWDAGLGVIGKNESTNGNDHQIDNTGGAVDFVLLQFDQAVSLTSIYRNVFRLDGNSTIDSDAAYWADTRGTLGTDWTKAIALQNYDISEKLWTDIAGGSRASTGTLTGNSDVYGSSAVPTSNVWLVGASFLATDRNDGFKIASLTVNYTPQAAVVPEPATWAMFIGGFGLVGGALRRRRSTGGQMVRFG